MVAKTTIAYPSVLMNVSLRQLMW